jgi:hypothetical protein
MYFLRRCEKGSRSVSLGIYLHRLSDGAFGDAKGVAEEVWKYSCRIGHLLP